MEFSRIALISQAVLRGGDYHINVLRDLPFVTVPLSKSNREKIDGGQRIVHDWVTN